MNVYLGGLYKEVEYIQSSGTQYINTGYASSNNTKVILSMGGRVSSVERYGALFGARKGWNSSDWDDSKGFSITYDKNSGYVVMFGRGYNNYISTVPDFGITNGNNHTIQEGGDGIYIDGTLKMSLTSYTFTSPVPMSIFCDNINGENVNFSSYKLYYFKIYNSGTLVRDFIPCYRISDNVIGLFDKVENKFYANAGTGTFTKGSDVGTFQPELKNAYIGEYFNLDYSYNLVGKSTSIMRSDGWTLSNAALAAFGTYGLYCNISGSANETCTNKGSLVLGGVKTITMTMTSRPYAENTSYSFNIGGISNISLYNAYSGRGFKIGGTSIVSTSRSTSENTQTLVFDLDNKTYSYSDTVGYTSNGSLTDTQIGYIKKATYFNIMAGCNGYTGSGNSGLKAMSLKVVS